MDADADSARADRGRRRRRARDHPSRPRRDAWLHTILTFGGPAVFLLAQFLFLREALGHLPRSRVLGLAALAIPAVATAPLTLIVGIAAPGAVLVAVAIADTVREVDQAPSRRA